LDSRIRLWVALGTVLLAACGGAGSSYQSAPSRLQHEERTAAHPVTQSNAAIATVQVAVASPGPTIPPDFAGMSIEVDDATQKYLGVDGAPNTVYEQFLRNLGSSVIRIGGNSTDYSCWNPNSAPYPQGCLFTITQGALTGYLRASADTHWSVTLGVNLAQNSASWTLPYGVAAANTAASVPGSSLIGFEFGNEPDRYPTQFLFNNHPYRPKGYSWQNLVSDWSPYVTAFKGTGQTAPIGLAGPVYDETPPWRDSYLQPFAQGIGVSNLGILTVHDYPTSVCGGKTVTIADLLSPSVISAYTAQAAGWIQVAAQLGLPLELGETNSASCHGQNGVSNVFASTVWGLDWLFANAQVGMRHVYFHNNGQAYYDPVVARRSGQSVYHDFVQPLYYAIYAFSTAAESNAILPTTVSSNANITAYSVRDGAGDTRVFIINKDLQASGKVTVQPSSPMGTASLLRIAAPTLGSKSVSFGGTYFDNTTGNLHGTPKMTTIATDAQGNYQIFLGRAAIDVLTISP